MPVPSLPFELIDLILSHLVSPISLAPPRFYRDLCSAALVCRSWAAVAQKLLWEQIYLSGGDEQVEQWLAVDFRPGWKVKALVLTEQESARGEGTEWTNARFLQLFDRCGGISRFSCTLCLEKLSKEAPDFLLQSFPALEHVGLAHPPALDSKQQFFPSTVKSFAFLPLEPLQHNAPYSSAATLAMLLAESQEQGHLALTRLKVEDLIVLRHLAVVAPSLRTLVLPSEPPNFYSTSTRSGELATFLAVCRNLTRLVVPFLWDAKLVAAVPPSVTHLDIGIVTANAFCAFCRAFERLSQSWTSVVQLRIQHPRNDKRFENMMELWGKVEQSCGSRGIEVVVSVRR
ncbi:hypothetical protein JCM10213_009101 [Rhodosporidiobolus nylandii]